MTTRGQARQCHAAFTWAGPHPRVIELRVRGRPDVPVPVFPPGPHLTLSPESPHPLSPSPFGRGELRRTSESLVIDPCLSFPLSASPERGPGGEDQPGAGQRTQQSEPPEKQGEGQPLLVAIDSALRIREVKHACEATA